MRRNQHRRPQWGTKTKRVRNGIIGLLAVVLIVLLPPVYLAKNWGNFARPLPEFLRFLLVCIVWVAVLYLLGWALFRLLLHHAKKQAPFTGRANMYEDALNALDRIAGGDYTVAVEVDERFRYSALGDKVNHLARQLSSMEQMRQDFVSNVSHEIQSPLTSIAGFAELLKKEELSREQSLHYIEVIQSEAARMSKLSDSLLRLSMLEGDGAPCNPGPFRLDKQIENVLLSHEPQWAAKQLQLNVQLQPVTYNGDEELLLQVWQNLLQNGIKFTPAGGGLTLQLGNRNGAITFALRDTGVGISEEDVVHIFERFYKVDKARERALGGNGLGLPLAKRIVELHKGQIWAESKKGHGSTFHVVLPTAPNAETP